MSRLAPAPRAPAPPEGEDGAVRARAAGLGRRRLVRPGVPHPPRGALHPGGRVSSASRSSGSSRARSTGPSRSGSSTSSRVSRAGHVATLMKVHHAMIDGLSGMHLTAALFDLSPELARACAAPAWEPEPEPSSQDLLREATESLVAHPFQALMSRVDAVTAGRPRWRRSTSARSCRGSAASWTWARAPRRRSTCRSGPTGGSAIADAPLQRFKEIKDALGGTVNDAVLTVVGGALHLLLRDRKEPTPGTHAAGDGAGLGAGRPRRVARATGWRRRSVDLPVGAMGPSAVSRSCARGPVTLKDSMMAMSADAIIGLGAYAPGGLLAAAARLASQGPWFNLVVSIIRAAAADAHGGREARRAKYPSLPARRELGAVDTRSRRSAGRWRSA